MFACHQSRTEEKNQKITMPIMLKMNKIFKKYLSFYYNIIFHSDWL
jgi:hypothetical protein